MKDFSDVSLKVKNYKCYGGEENGFDCLKPVNLIIGRNNSGKSALLDLVELATLEIGSHPLPEEVWHKNKKTEVFFERTITGAHAGMVFKRGARHEGVPGDHQHFGESLVGARLKWKESLKDSRQFVSIGESPDGMNHFSRLSNNQARWQNQLIQTVENPLRGLSFKRIQAERNINPEKDSQSTLDIYPDGSGVTNLIQNYLNKAGKPEYLVEDLLLNDLNFIFGSDADFSRIICMQRDTGEWEIYLQEENKGKIALSNSGSGLKTIIMVLVYMHLVPKVEKKKIEDYVFGFEELENNLHPSLQRRLLNYLFGKSEKEGATFFLTTHSNVAIDLFSKASNAQILHVTHDKDVSNVRTVSTYVENKGLLEDLDVRASDLLQSNCVIWVEGPSDRIYINHWIDLWSEGSIKEGNHYQCVFYGGKLLSHLYSEEPNMDNSGVSILNVNRNGILLMDSDKKNKQGSLNKTKKRMISEVDNMNGVSWVTKGKEIENYISGKSIGKFLKKSQDVEDCPQYHNFFEYLESVDDGLSKYKNQKPLFAENICAHTERVDLDVLDLSLMLEKICNQIEVWNAE